VYPAEFDYLPASSAAAALDVLAGVADDDEIKVLAGGQSLLPMMKLRLAVPGVLLDIGGLAELASLDVPADGIGDGPAARIGALVTYRSLLRDARVATRFPAMADALRVLADPQVRARGTIGGALAHADPAADLPAVLLALDAGLALARAGGSRSVALDDFLLGAYETGLAADELITEITVSRSPAGQAYRKFEQPASHLPLAGVCAVVELADDTIASARIAVTGVAGRVFRARAAETALAGRPIADDALDAAAARVGDGAPRPLADIHASGAFRLHLAEVLTRRALRTALRRAMAAGGEAR
jgi:carbon-monoxide dehydrogenase medium subunit